MLVLGVPSARALWRLARHRSLVKDEQVAERWGTATLIVLMSCIAGFLAANVAWAIWSTYPDFDGNAAGPLVLALTCCAIALLCGECVLVGNGV